MTVETPAVDTIVAMNFSYFIFKERATLVRRTYTVVLGCTHYPYLSRVIGDVMGPSVRLIDSGEETALEVARTLGVGESARPREAVAHLVEHFRRFRPSPKRPSGYGLGLYRELALTARGICR